MNKFQISKFQLCNNYKNPSPEYKNIELMLILPTQMIRFQHLFESADAQLYVDKIRFVRVSGIWRKSNKTHPRLNDDP